MRNSQTRWSSMLVIALAAVAGVVLMLWAWDSGPPPPDTSVTNQQETRDTAEQGDLPTTAKQDPTQGSSGTAAQ
jgi:hypothetical protein